MESAWQWLFLTHVKDLTQTSTVPLSVWVMQICWDGCFFWSEIIMHELPERLWKNDLVRPKKFGYPPPFPFSSFECVFIELLILWVRETLYSLSFMETIKDLQLLQWKLMKHKCFWSCQQETDGWRERSWTMIHLWSLSGGHSSILVLGTSSREQHCGWFFWRKTGEEKNHKWHIDDAALKIMWWKYRLHNLSTASVLIEKVLKTTWKQRSISSGNYSTGWKENSRWLLGLESKHAWKSCMDK